MGRVQDAGTNLSRAACALARAEPAGRIFRNPRKRLSGARRLSGRGARRVRLCRCRDAARLPRGDKPSERGADKPATGGRGLNAQIAREEFTPERIQDRVRELGSWFQNLDLHGVQTAPEHFLGDYPAAKWRRFAHAIPADLRGKTVLDIGCNAGFYSMEMKRRGADRVLGVDFDPAYLAQARFAAEVVGMDIEFRQLSVYDVAQLGEKFDVVIFMGVLYHLRHPLLALDLVREYVAKDLLVFQSMQRGSTHITPVEPDYDFWQTEIFERPDFPQMYFI